MELVRFLKGIWDEIVKDLELEVWREQGNGSIVGSNLGKY